MQGASHVHLMCIIMADGGRVSVSCVCVVRVANSVQYFEADGKLSVSRGVKERPRGLTQLGAPLLPPLPAGMDHAAPCGCPQWAAPRSGARQ